MIKEIKLLTFLELQNLYGINVFRHEKDKKAKRRYLLLLCIWIFLILMVWGYVGGMSFGLVLLGMAELVPAYLVMLATLLVLVFGFFKAGGQMFRRKGYDIISSFPVRTSSIVVSRFLEMYAEDLLLTYAILLPGTVVYGIAEQPGPGFYSVMILSGLFVPALPLVLDTAVGVLITGISARMKHNSLVQTVLMIAVVLLVMVGSFGTGQMSESFTPEMLRDLADTMAELMGQMYPPAVWVANAAVSGEWLRLAVFAGMSVVAVVLMVAVIERFFHGICRKLFVTVAKHNYQMEHLKSSRMLAALYKKELKRYFASSIYVTNTIIGPIMGTIMAAALFFAGVDGLQGLFAQAGNAGAAVGETAGAGVAQTMVTFVLDIGALVPFVIAGVFTMMTATSVSISMEGKEIWIAKTLPIPFKTFLDGKILMNLSLIAPFYLVSEVFMILALKPGIMELLWFILIPATVILFALVLGITVNLKMHSFDWAKEGAVVKQSASAMLGGFAGMLVSALCAVAVLVCPAQISDLVRLLLCAVLALLTAVMYRKNGKRDFSTL